LPEGFIPTLETHFPLAPKWHQMVAVATMLAKGFCHTGESQPAYFSTILADEMGLGKTWVALMLGPGLRAVRQNIANGITSPVTAPYKSAFFVPAKGQTEPPPE
jgi:hypothetical protein